MSSSEIIINEQALAAVSGSINDHINAVRDLLSETIEKLKANNEDWNDEDFEILLSAIKEFMAEAAEFESEAGKLTKRIEQKIDAIHQLHSMKI